jgi:outer membrane protein TolC
MKHTIILIFISFSVGQSIAQDTLRLSLDEAVALALEQSPQAVAARHQYRAAYWNWRSHKANYLPSLTFNSYTSLNRSISSVTR